MVANSLRAIQLNYHKLYPFLSIMDVLFLNYDDQKYVSRILIVKAYNFVFDNIGDFFEKEKNALFI